MERRVHVCVRVCVCVCARTHMCMWSQLLSVVQLYNPMEAAEDSTFLCPWDSPDKNTGVSCHFLFQGIFPTQGLNPGLLFCRQILYQWATWNTILTGWPGFLFVKPGNPIDWILSGIQNVTVCVWAELSPDRLVCQYFLGLWWNLQGMGLKNQLNDHVDLHIFPPVMSSSLSPPPLQQSPPLLVS